MSTYHEFGKRMKESNLIIKDSNLIPTSRPFGRLTRYQNKKFDLAPENMSHEYVDGVVSIEADEMAKMEAAMNAKRPQPLFMKKEGPYCEEGNLVLNKKNQFVCKLPLSINDSEKLRQVFVSFIYERYIRDKKIDLDELDETNPVDFAYHCRRHFNAWNTAGKKKKRSSVVKEPKLEDDKADEISAYHAALFKIDNLSDLFKVLQTMFSNDVYETIRNMIGFAKEMHPNEFPYYRRLALVYLAIRI